MLTLLYTSTVLHIVLALYVFFSQKKTILHLSFSGLAIFIAFWAFSNAQFQITDNYDSLYKWALIAYNVMSVLLIFLLVFSYAVTESSISKRSILIFIFVFCLSFFLPHAENFVLVDVRFQPREIVTGQGILLLFGAYLYYIVYSTVNIYLGYRNAVGIRKKQIRAIFLGMFAVVCSGMLFNLILPFWGQYSLVGFGPTFTLIFLFFVAFAIVKYQFLDIRVLVGRITYYSMFMILFIISYYAIYVFDQKIFGGAFTWGAFVSGLVIAAFFSFFFVKFNDYLRVQVRTRIINPGYDPLEVLDVLSRKVASLLEIDKIIDVSIHALDQTVRADYEALIVMPTDKRQREFVFESTKKSKNLDLVLFSELKQIWNDIGNIPVVYQEIEYEMPEVFGKYSVTIEKIFKYMSQKHIRLILPLRESEKNPGMLILGQKESDGIYTMQDIEFVQGVATTIGLAMTRAFYFLEAQDLNVNLQKRVDEATKELQYKNNRLEKAMKKIEDIRQQERDMIDVMGHELRTPITIVRNALLVLLSKIKGRKEVRVLDVKEYVEKALESARREINLVETLLSATKVESNRIQMNLTKIDMIDVVEDSLEAHKDIAKDKKIKIHFVKPKKKVWGYADRTRMQEVMDNFLSNAVKYTLRGEVKIWIEAKSKDVQISIQDTGIGISEEDIARLGKKFFRAKQYLKDDDGETNGVVRPGGTGLGLYVSFNLIRIMQGNVKVTSKVGQGSVFAFSVPKFSNQPDRHIDQTFEEQI